MTDSLLTALVEIDRHVGHAGWDQPVRLFALVSTAHLLDAEPSLRASLARPGLPSDSLSSVEQDGFSGGDDLIGDLARIAWPESVLGCAIVVERLFLPADAEGDLPDDPEAAASVVASHPRRQDVRLVAGVTRDGRSLGLARFRNDPADLVAGDDLVPALTAALNRTLQ